MSTIQQDILEMLFQELEKSDEFDDEIITMMRQLFDDKKKIRSSDLVQLLSSESKEKIP